MNLYPVTGNEQNAYNNADNGHLMFRMFSLPHLLPSALSDFSQKLTAVAPFLPSYQLYEPIKSIILDGGSISKLSQEWLYLLIFGLASLCGSYLLMKKTLAYV
ncbi:MAG: hypothetical protein WCK54_03215 [Desulfuromonadales bacterium]